jgi:hypothetical protein
MNEGIYELYIMTDGGNNTDLHIHPENKDHDNIISVYQVNPQSNNNIERRGDASRKFFWFDNVAGGAGDDPVMKVTIYNFNGYFKKVIVSMGDTRTTSLSVGVWKRGELWKEIGKIRTNVNGSPVRTRVIVRKIL